MADFARTGESSKGVQSYSVDMDVAESRRSTAYFTEASSPTSFLPTHDEFKFIPSTSSSLHGLQTGGALDMGPTDDVHLTADTAYVRHRGKTSQFLENKGFAWLLEVDDQDEASQKPLLEELDIDLKDIYHKLRCVLLPIPQLGFDRQIVRDNPDFWGPLIVVFLFSIFSLYGQFRVISWIITIWFFGSLLIFMLARVLGGEVNYSQCLGVIGYSLLPLIITAAVGPAIRGMHFIEMVFKVFGVIWATYSAGSLLCVQELQHKRPLLLYPIMLLYIYFLSLYTGA